MEWMPDPLYLNLWFPSFPAEEMLPRALGVLRLFPFSDKQPGVQYVELHPVSWNEASTLEERFQPGIAPEQAVLLASAQIHEDYAYVFEAAWDLWMLPGASGPWVLQPSPVKFMVHGVEFAEGAFASDGHMQIDFGLDAPFLQTEVQLTAETESRVRANVQKLIDFTSRVEENSGANARLLWSDSDENLAQKLIARLQRVQ